MVQILESSRLAAVGQRPICQDTGMVTVVAKLGQDAHIKSEKALSKLINDGVRLVYLDAKNPLWPQ
jgi:fumarate hydratase class I